jgi:hypothetical protein
MFRLLTAGAAASRSTSTTCRACIDHIRSSSRDRLPGPGIAWQTAIGAELGRVAIDPRYDPALPFSPLQAIPFHPMKALGVAATIAAYRAFDRLGPQLTRSIQCPTTRSPSKSTTASRC